MTTNSAGKMQNSTGNSTLIGTFMAFSSASWRRLRRIWLDWTRRTLAIDTPKMSACTIARTKAPSSGTLLRAARLRMASPRPRPSWTSCRVRDSSCDSGPVVLRATWARAASKPRPASTLMVSRSTESGRASRISACLRWIWLASTMSGAR